MSMKNKGIRAEILEAHSSGMPPRRKRAYAREMKTLCLKDDA